MERPRVGMIRRLRMLVAKCAAVSAVCVSAGCYTYAPASLSEIAPEQEVRLRLSQAESRRLDAFVHESGRDLDGKVVEAEGDSLMLLVPTHSELRGIRVETINQRINVATPGVLDVEVRKLDRGRSALLTGAVVGALAAVVISRISGGGGSPPATGGGGPAESIIPARPVGVSIFRFAIPGG